ncbi:hypothetical protein APASM_6961 [Actinosynnema pretiosum subsp. pretiosum]|nr:hypothetical protein APASM_6961 [Actinosynnema pretiosum subsp. pretiosum]
MTTLVGGSGHADLRASVGARHRGTRETLGFAVLVRWDSG